MTEEKMGRSEQQIQRHGERVASLVVEVGEAFGVNPPEVDRLKRYTQWLFCEGAHYGVVIAGMPNADKEKQPDATETYIQEEDLIADFLEECCRMDSEFEMPVWVIYDAYKEWFSENVSKRIIPSRKKFDTLMGDRFDQVNRGTGFYKGLRLMVPDSGSSGSSCV